MSMDRGEPPFLVDYTHKGKRFCTTVGGDSWTEAEAHLKSIGANGRIVGSNVHEYSANPVTLPFVHVWVVLSCWWRNLWRKA